MKKKRSTNLIIKPLWLIIGFLVLCNIQLSAHSLTLSSTTYENKIVVQQCESYNACYWIAGGWTRIDWYLNGALINSDYSGSMSLGYRTINVQNKEFDCRSFTPGQTIQVKAKIYHHDAYSYGYWADELVAYQTLQSYTNVSNFQASDGLFMHKINLSWNLNEKFLYNFYVIQQNNQDYYSYLSEHTTSYVVTGLAEGTTNNYRVKSIINPVGNYNYEQLSSNDQGSTFYLNFRATNNLNNNIVLNWNDFRNTYHAAGCTVDWWDESSSGWAQLWETTDNTYINRPDNGSLHQFIPGYPYQYRIRVKPTTESDVVGYATGKTKPNGTISGDVKTPASGSNPTGVGVPNVQIIAILQGDTLPSDTTTTYSTTTDANGHYEIPNIYYYTGATFRVTPILDGRTFSPTQTDVTLNLSNSSETANFTDMSSFIISGVVSNGTCPMEGILILLNGDSSGVSTNANGEYSVTVANGGNHTIKPLLNDHLFNPASNEVTVTANTTGVNFSDTTQYTVDGYFTASCNSYIGQATLRFFSDDNGNCFSDTVTTNSSGYYAIKLPARKLHVELLDFTSTDEQLVSTINVRAFFSSVDSLNLTYYDSTEFHHDTLTKSFVYRLAPHLNIINLDADVTCSGETIPLLQQHANTTIKFEPLQEFNGSSCPAEDGVIYIAQDITSYDNVIHYDTIVYHKGDTITYTFIPGAPNIISPYKKFIDAKFISGGMEDNLHREVIVIGQRARSQTFTTTSPQMPFHVLHNPPGDASYSYLEENSSISNAFETSFLQEGSVDTYVRVQISPTFSVNAGFMGNGVSTEARVQFDVTGSFGTGCSGLTSDAVNITTTASERFQTSGNVNITGGSGDVYIGGALNMLYAVSDVVDYDFLTCELKTRTTLEMQPNGISTTFMYTEDHITNVIIPELQGIVDHYNSINKPDSANYFQNQLHVWQQVVSTNHTNINNSTFIENKTFSGGVLYENTVETTRDSTHTYDFNWYLDYGVAVDAGASYAGCGIFGGAAVHGRSTWGNVTTSDVSNTTTVGYVLSDDDLGDSYTVDIKNDNVYGVPVFKLVAGRSSCPWEPGTLPREGMQLLSDTYSQSVEETQQAVYTLQLGNTSQSDEDMTYNLVFDQTSNPDGATITIGGSPVVGNVPFPYTIPAGQAVNATVTVGKGPIEKNYHGLKFTLKSSCDDQIYQDVYLNAYFYKNYQLTVAVNGSGNTNIAVGNHVYQDGSSVLLFASATQGYVFQKWVVGTTEYTTQAVEISVDSNLTATAYFIPTSITQYNLQILSEGNGTSVPPSGDYYYNQGTSVHLRALPQTNNAFIKWVVNGAVLPNFDTTITLTQNTVATAYFLPTHTLNVSVAQGSGTVTPSTGDYPLGDIKHLYASPAPGFIFEKWVINDTINTLQAVDITVNRNIEALAYFTPTTLAQDTITVEVIGAGTTVPPAGTHYVIHGMPLNLSSQPNDGTIFQKWNINGIETTNPTVSFNITGDASIQAYFIMDTTTTGIGNHFSNNRISVYPNPTKNIVNITSSDLIENITLADITGKTIYEMNEIGNTAYSLSLAHFATGFYFIRLKTKDESFVYKIQVIN